MRSRQPHPKVGVAVMMLRSPPPPRLKVVDLNPHLSCILCGGYFIDATTITECLHSFCRACIVRYLETSEYCPVCEVQVHKSKPLRSDKILQDIVYKLVPGLFHNEMKRRRELYASQPPEALKESRDAEDRGECLDEKFIYAPDEIFSLSIEYEKEAECKDSTAEEDNVPKRRFLRCPAAVTISHLKKFVRMKYGIPNSYEVDLKYDKEFLRDEYTLMDVAYIFLWKRRGPLRFFYKIVEKPPKKAKLTEQHMFTEDCVETATSGKEQPLVTKDNKEAEVVEKQEEQKNAPCQTPVQPVVAPQSQQQSEKEQAPPAQSTVPSTLSEPVEKRNPGGKDLEEPIKPTTDTVPVHLNPVPSVESVEKMDTTVDESSTAVVSSTSSNSPSKKESTKPVVMPFKLPGSITQQLNKNSTATSTETSKPAVMTVAPLTKPSHSLPTTSTSPTITHGSYTGISIKKSPPNTLPPFKISAHLLTPKVPPLKLSPPRFSKQLETCLRELSSSSKKSSASKKSKSSKDNKLELKVAQLKSASSSSATKCVAPLVITVPPEAKLNSDICRKETVAHNNTLTIPSQAQTPKPEKKPETKSCSISPSKTFCAISERNQRDKERQPQPESSTVPAPPPPPPPLPQSSIPETRVTSAEDNKMDLEDSSELLFEGPLVIADDGPLENPSKDDSDNSNIGNNKPVGTASSKGFSPPFQKHEDSDDEEIDVVDDGEVDSGRGSDVSSRTEARSLCGFDDDLGSPDSVPKTPEAEHRHPPLTPSSTTNHHHGFLPDIKPPAGGGLLPKTNGVSAPAKTTNGQSATTNGSSDLGGVLDLSTSHTRKRPSSDGPPPHHRAKQVANPAVLDKTRQTSTPCVSPNPFKVLTGAPADMPAHIGLYKSKHHDSSSSGSRGNFKCRSTLTVINPDPNGSIPKIVIRNLGPRPDRGRFHHHHHHHHNHH